MRTTWSRVGRLAAFVLLVLSVRRLVLRRRSTGAETPASLALVPAVEQGRPGELPGDVLATDAGLTAAPEAASRDVAKAPEAADSSAEAVSAVEEEGGTGELPGDVVATDAGLTPEPEATSRHVPQPPDAAGTSPAARPSGPDNLRAIRGIGPAIERTLHGLDITTYRQIAALEGPELERVRGALQDFRARVEREDWPGQARELHRAKYGEDA